MASTAGAASVLARAPITFEAANGDVQHAPLIAARVGGLDTLLVLDTGSEVHLLTKELVDRLGLAVAEGEEGTDHSGATLPSWTVEDVPLELGPLEPTLRDVVAIPAPRPFLGWGIGGILSPQHLQPGAWTVVDLVEDELLLVEGPDETVAAWLATRTPALTTVVLDRDRTFTSVVVPAAIGPHAELPTLLDTGGRHTEFSADAVPEVVPDAAPERLGGGVGGTDVVGAMVGPATLVVARHEVAVPSLAVRASMHDPQGLVGMDVLRGTILAVSAELGRPVLWRIPTGPGGGAPPGLRRLSFR